MNTGWVYVLSNASMPNMVKVGCTYATGSDPESRAAELSSTSGVPTPFEVQFAVKVTGGQRTIQSIERAAHAALAAHRVNAGREFFAVNASTAASAILSNLQSAPLQVIDAAQIRIEATRICEQQRIESERRMAEQFRIAEEQQRIANERQRIAVAREKEEQRRAKEADRRSASEHATWATLIAVGAFFVGYPGVSLIAGLYLAWLIWCNGTNI